MTDWPEYVSHKVVRAAQIVSVTRTPDDELILWVGDYPYEKFEPTEPGMAKRATVGYWAILYEDGFKSVSPNQAFSEGYIPKSLMPTEPKNLEQAIECAINKFSAENGSNTPDFILAQFLTGALAAWNAAVVRREKWYGRLFGGISGPGGNSVAAPDGPARYVMEGNAHEATDEESRARNAQA